MNISELITDLTEQGVQLWPDRDKLRIHAPKGLLTAQLQSALAAHKADILTFLRQGCEAETKTATGLSLQTIGRLLSGTGSQTSGSAERFKPPVIDPSLMAKQLKVTLRPLPSGFAEAEILQFREDLGCALQRYGVQLVPWLEATREFDYKLPIPWLNKSIPMRVVKSDIHAVIDVERPVNRVKSCLAERLYQVYSRFFQRDQQLSVAQIAQLVGWSEDHALQRLEDPTATQVILITPLDDSFADEQTPYQHKIAMGVNTLISQFSEIVIGVSQEKISILNMNLSDSLFSRQQLETFVLKSLIPKIYVPIAPLPMSQFELGCYDAHQSNYARQLVRLGQAMAKTDLLPSGFKLAEVIKRQSHRDMVAAMVNGRTGVSYGFVAYVEPPQYEGALEISLTEWEALSPVEGLSPAEVRQNSQGRRYLKTRLQDQVRYRQIPDIWLVCSRSGAKKTDLDLGQDILRLGLTDKLCLQLPVGVNPAAVDIKPSYDTYVMVAIALAAALYMPDLIADGAPMVHFHGYPARDWFAPQEGYAGVDNPSVPCGTYESGVFNFLSIHRLAEQSGGSIQLAALIEPDHGANLIAPDLDYLLARLEAALQQDQLELGGRHFASLTEPVVA
jgi:hypothetical protein